MHKKKYLETTNTLIMMTSSLIQITYHEFHIYLTADVNDNFFFGECIKLFDRHLKLNNKNYKTRNISNKGKWSVTAMILVATNR